MSNKHKYDFPEIYYKGYDAHWRRPQDLCYRWHNRLGSIYDLPSVVTPQFKEYDNKNNTKMFRKNNFPYYTNMFGCRKRRLNFPHKILQLDKHFKLK